MGKEIEHKFLLINNDWRPLVERSSVYRQGYLATNERCSVRVRVAAGQAWLNLKGTTLGVARAEYEVPVDLDEAESILETLCARPLIEKTRHFIHHEAHLWEVDEFHGDNAGLVVAEVELQSEDEEFSRPDWVGKDVSLQKRYYNVCLVRHPYSQWSDAEKRGETLPEQDPSLAQD